MDPNKYKVFHVGTVTLFPCLTKENLLPVVLKKARLSLIFKSSCTWARCPLSMLFSFTAFSPDGKQGEVVYVTFRRPTACSPSCWNTRLGRLMSVP